MIPNPKTIIALSMLGVVYALLTVFSLIVGLEHRIALSIIIIVGVTAYLTSTERKLATAFSAGFAVVFVAIWTQIAFHDQYVANYPQYAEVEVPLGLTPITYTMLFSPFGAIAGSLIAGAAAVLLHLAWMLRRRLR